MKEVVIVLGVRILVGKVKKGLLVIVCLDDLGVICVKEMLKWVGGYEGNIDDLIIGCVIFEVEQGFNMVRNIGVFVGLLYMVLVIIVNCYCFLGFQFIVYVVEKIMLGVYDIVIVGGVEFML